MKIFSIAFVLYLASMASLCRADVVNIVALDSSRTLDFASNPGFSAVRDDLFDPNLFGSSGIVDTSFNILPSVASMTQDQLENVDIAIFVATQTEPISAELDSLASFVHSGGGLFVFGNHINSFAPLIGGTAGAFPGSGSTATVVDGTSPLVAGPFGTLGVGETFPIQFHGVLADGGPQALVGISAPSGAFGLSLQYGEGRIVLIGDEELFLSSDPGVAAIPTLTESSRLVFRNSVAYVTPTAVPEPSSMALLTLGSLTLIGARKARKRR